jgi:DNA-binding MarR family transcriptional regulator
MTRISAALAKAGYVKRSVDPDDRRYVYLEATRRGVALLDEGRRRRIARLSAMLADLTARELVDCERALAALRRVVGA